MWLQIWTLKQLLTIIAFSVLLLVPIGVTNAYAHDAPGDESCGTLTLVGGQPLDSTTGHTLWIDPPAPKPGDDVTVTSERTDGSIITFLTRNLTIFKFFNKYKFGEFLNDNEKKHFVCNCCYSSSI